jgi:hypothetical protein
MLLHFEFAHLLIFFWAMVYTGNALVSVFRLTQTRRGWDRIANTETRSLCHRVETKMGTRDADDHVKSGMSSRPDKIAHSLFEQGKTSWKPMWAGLLPYSEPTFEDCEWKILQRLFLRNFKLPVDFDYPQYITQKLNQRLAGSLEVKPSTWLIWVPAPTPTPCSRGSGQPGK